MTPDPTEIAALCERLRGLMAKATPGPWEFDTEPNEDGEYGPGPDPGRGFDDYMILGAESGKILGTENATHKSIVEEFDDEGYKNAWDEIGQINAALITEAVNALPVLLDALEALSAGGWKLVPVEPTREMWAAGGNAVLGHRQRHHDKVVKDVWSAMLAASPQQGGAA